MHNSDYKLVGGFNRNLTDWDSDLFQRQIATKLKVGNAFFMQFPHKYLCVGRGIQGL